MTIAENGSVSVNTTGIKFITAPGTEPPAAISVAIQSCTVTYGITGSSALSFKPVFKNSFYLINRKQENFVISILTGIIREIRC